MLVLWFRKVKPTETEEEEAKDHKSNMSEHVTKDLRVERNQAHGGVIGKETELRGQKTGRSSVVTITNKAYEQHNKLHSNSGRAGRDNTRRNAGHVSERRARGEAGGEIRNETSCFDEGVAVGGVQCTRNEAYAYGGVNVLGRREEKREVESGVLGVVRNEAYGLGSLGRREERSRGGYLGFWKWWFIPNPF